MTADSKPSTVVPVEPAPPTGNNWQKDVAHYPEPLTPFGWSLMHACEREIKGVFDEMGLLVRGLEEAFVGGEVYGRVEPAFGSANSAGKPPPAIVLGIAARVVPALRRRTATARRAVDQGHAARWLAEWHATDRAAMVAEHAALARIDLAALSDDELVGHLDACLALARRGMQIHFRLVMPYFGALHRLHLVVHEHLGWEDAAVVAMLAGHSPATTGGAEAMARLRAQLAPAATVALDADPAHPVDALRRVDPTSADALEAWMDEHGQALLNYDAGVPVLAERPELLTRMLLSRPEPADVAQADQTAARARDALADEVRPAFDEALAAARAVYPVREDNTIITGDRPLSLLRRWMLEAGERLARRGALAAADDAAYLFVDEARDAVTGVGEDGIAAVVARRRGEEAWVRAHPGPLHVGAQGAPPDISRLPEPLRLVNEPVLWGISHEYPTDVDHVPTDGDDAVLLRGVGGAPGVAEGPARIIDGHEDMMRLDEGDVLVCRVTSPAWSPVFPLAAAVVTDGGGALSHAAIAAREHGIPAVLGTGTGTLSLRDGQRVRVDGTQGLVLVADS